MYTEEMLESIKKVEASRASRIGKELRRMDADEKDNLLKEFHPDYKESGFATLEMGPNKGEKAPAELAELLQANSRVLGKDIDLTHPDYDVDVLVIGGGGAGASAAIEAHNGGANVMIVTKLRIGDANTMMAEGGIQAADKENDSPQRHYLDAFGGGHFAAKPELLLDSSYFVPWLLPSRARLFTPVSYTQRPAAASAKLCEGRIVVLVNGSPSAMVLPALFCENFECLDDYASTAVFASFLRVLNYASFYLTVFLPGAFVCLAVYLPELIPPQLLYKIEAAEKATPLPLFAEMLLVILLLEVIREAGLRMPQSLGHSVSLVAALILGDAAIATGLMSTPVIFVASITSIAVFVTPALYEPATLLRIGVVVAAGLAGPVGLAGAFFVLLLSLSGTGMLGVPYLAQHPFPQSPLAEDGVIRRNYRYLSRKGFNIWQKRRPRA